MAELFLLGFQILFGVRAGLDFAGHALDDFDAGTFESLDLLGIIREQAHLAYAERFEHLAGRAKSRWSALKPRRSLASTVSRPESCNS